MKYVVKKNNKRKGGELLQVEDLDVRHPDLVHQGDVHWDQRFILVSKLKDFNERFYTRMK